MLEIVKTKVLEARLSDGPYKKVERPVGYVNSQISNYFVMENGQDKVPSLVNWLNTTVMRFPAMRTRGQLFAAALRDLYGDDWSVLVTDPMKMYMKHGKSLAQIAATIQFNSLGFGPQEGLS